MYSPTVLHMPCHQNALLMWSIVLLSPRCPVVGTLWFTYSLHLCDFGTTIIHWPPRHGIEFLQGIYCIHSVVATPLTIQTSLAAPSQLFQPLNNVEILFLTPEGWRPMSSSSILGLCISALPATPLDASITKVHAYYLLMGLRGWEVRVA